MPALPAESVTSDPLRYLHDLSLREKESPRQMIDAQRVALRNDLVNIDRKDYLYSIEK